MASNFFAQLISRQEVHTIDGSQVIRKFHILPYELATQFELVLLGIKNVDGSDPVKRIYPSRDTYFGDFYCSKVECCAVDDTGWTANDSIAEGEEDEHLTKFMKTPSKQEKAVGGAIVTVYYTPVISAGNWITEGEEQRWNFVNYRMEPFAKPIPIPKTALLNIKTITGSAEIAKDINCTKMITGYNISFTRMNITYSVFATEQLMIAKLTGTVNKSKIEGFPGATNAVPNFEPETLMFNGVTPYYKYNGGVVDLTYHFTWLTTVDEYLEFDGTAKRDFIGHNRVLQYPGIKVKLGGLGGRYLPLAWYGVGWRKTFCTPFFGGSNISPMNIYDEDVQLGGFLALFTNFG